MKLTKRQQEVLQNLRDYRGTIHRVDWREKASSVKHVSCYTRAVDPRGEFNVNIATVRKLVEAGFLVWDADQCKYWLVENLRSEELAKLQSRV